MRQVSNGNKVNGVRAHDECHNHVRGESEPPNAIRPLTEQLPWAAVLESPYRGNGRRPCAEIAYMT